MRLGIHTHALSSLTIKSTSHTNTFFYSFQTSFHPPGVLTRQERFRQPFRCFSRRYFLRALYTCVYNARQYSVVKDLDCLSNQFERVSTRLNSLLISLLLLVGVVGPDGIEPSTSPLSGVRSSHLSYGPRCRSLISANTGGAGRDRTGDLLSANQALSQLSYSPLIRPAPSAAFQQPPGAAFEI